MRGLIPWIWHGRDAAATLLRTGLAPASAGLRAAAAVRASAYRAGYFRSRPLPLPSVCVGNLASGGAGKTPVASWIAAWYAARGLTPGILLRGYGHDEGPLHREMVPTAVVVENPDRIAGARTAQQAGADVLVLDDGFQRLGVRRDLDIVLVSAESLLGSRRTLPAGPWREPEAALERAHFGIITRKQAPAAGAAEGLEWMRARLGGRPVALASLGIAGLEGLWSGTLRKPGGLAGARVVATAGIADPHIFAAQLQELGAGVELIPWRDHHAYDRRDVARLVMASKDADAVVMTAKDAVKLRRAWPRGSPEPLVARLELRWDSGGDAVRQALELLLRGGESRWNS